MKKILLLVCFLASNALYAEGIIITPGELLGNTDFQRATVTIKQENWTNTVITFEKSSNGQIMYTNQFHNGASHEPFDSDSISLSYVGREKVILQYNVEFNSNGDIKSFYSPDIALGKLPKQELNLTNNDFFQINSLKLDVSKIKFYEESSYEKGPFKVDCVIIDDKKSSSVSLIEKGVSKIYVQGNSVEVNCSGVYLSKTGNREYKENGTLDVRLKGEIIFLETDF